MSRSEHNGLPFVDDRHSKPSVHSPSEPLLVKGHPIEVLDWAKETPARASRQMVFERAGVKVSTGGG